MQKVKFYLILLAVLSVLSLSALAWVILGLAPTDTTRIILFFVLVFLSCFCIFALGGFYLRKLFGPREFLNSYILTASRQGLWFAFILVISLFLLSRNLFSWFNASLLILTFVFFESYLLTRKIND